MTQTIKQQTIFRTEKTRDFTQISNSLFSNKEISIESRFLLATMLSFKDDWVFCKAHLMDYIGVKRHAFNTAWGELVEKGYITSDKIPAKKSQFERPIYTLHEDPNSQNSVNKSLTSVDFQQSKDNLNVNKCLTSADFQLRPKSTCEVLNNESTEGQIIVNECWFPAVVESASNNTESIPIHKQQHEGVAVFLKNSFDLEEMGLTKYEILNFDKFDESRVTLAIAYTKKAKIKTTKLQTLIWHCQQIEPPSHVIPKPLENEGLAQDAFNGYESNFYEIVLDKEKINFVPLCAQGDIISIKFNDENFRREIWNNLTRGQFKKKAKAKIS